MSRASPTFVLTLQSAPGRDPIRALRALLKIAGRRLGLKALDAREVRTKNELRRVGGKVRGGAQIIRRQLATCTSSCNTGVSRMSNFTDYTDDLETPTEDDLNNCYGSKYLSALDVGDRKVRSKIAKVRKEAMQQRDGKPERSKFVIYLTTLPKPMVLNATNKNAIVDRLGRKPADWVGAEVGLFTEPTTFGGQSRGLRLRVLSTPKAAAAPKPATKPAPAEEATWNMEDPDHTGEGMDFGEAAE